MIKKIAYVCRWSIEKNDGVSQKIHNQMRAWRDLGIEVKLFCRSPSLDKDIPEQGLYAMPRPFSFWRRYEHIHRDIDAFAPDIIYCRYEIPTAFSCSLTKKYKEKTVIEINSYDMEELKLLCSLEPIKYIPRLMINFIGRNILFKNCGCIVSPMYKLGELPDFTKFNKKIIIAPNSIRLQEYPIVKKASQTGKIGHLLFLGSANQPWHGIDKVVELAESLGEDYHVHIVGPDSLKKSSSNVTWHGYLKPEDYREVASNCIAAINSMALYRNKMVEGCALKVREYIALGLPVILSHPDSSFIEELPEWVCQIPNNESNTDKSTVEKIKIFLKKIENRVISHEESAKFIDSSILEKNRIEELNKWFSTLKEM